MIRPRSRHSKNLSQQPLSSLSLKHSLSSIITNVKRFSLLIFSLLILSTAVSGELPITGEFPDESLIRQFFGGDANSLDLSKPHQHFSLFKKRFNKSYAFQEEHDYRFEIFKANLRRAQRHQALDPTAVHGVTRFSDLTQSEFMNEFLGVRTRLKYPSHANKAPILPTDELPLDFDWRELGAVTPPKDQSGCGSCWSYSATGAMEGAHFIATGKLESLSEQQLLDCDRECDPEGEPDDCDQGCLGGLMNNAFEYLLKAGGLMREKDYPYTARNGRCRFDKSKIAAKVANFSVVPVDEGQIAANLVKNGPLAVGINARYMSTYIGGVSCPLTCSADLEHGVLLAMVLLVILLCGRKRSHIGLLRTLGVNTGERKGITDCVGVMIFVVSTLWFLLLLRLLLALSKSVGCDE